MKNIIISAMVLAVALFAGCSKDEMPEQNVKYKVQFSVADRSELSTRAAKSGWEDGDQVLIVFEGESDWFDVTNGANTLKLTYNDGVWNADESKMPTSGLVSGKRYTACHHQGEVSLGEVDYFDRFVFSGYKGGEWMSYTGTYTVAGGVVDLGEIALERDAADFQISVDDLTGSNWKMTINSIKSMTVPTYYDGSIYHYKAGHINVRKGEMAFVRGYGNAAGVEYGGDVSFYFKKYSDIPYTTIVFGLSNGTNTYYYTKTGTSNETLQGGKAYLLPAINSGKWTN